MGIIEDNKLFVQVQLELEQMQPYLLSHGGQIELVSVEGFNVVIRLKGACDTCPLSFYTVTFGLEQRLQKAIDPGVRIIIQD